MDLSKLTPAPWKADCESTAWVASKSDCALILCNDPIHGGEAEENAAFIALARNAFDVMMRRECGIQKLNRWVLTCKTGWLYLAGRNWIADDLAIAYELLVEADKWYVANVENAK